MDFENSRKRMVDSQLVERGIKNERVLFVFLNIPRHEFVAPELRGSAYDDRPLPIGSGQTISQPYMAALMTELLELTDKMKVLELGTGSGYQASILGALAREVYSVERIAGLAETAAGTLYRLGIKNVHIKIADGSIGLEEFQPYDAIMVTAGAPRVPQALLDQLKDGGRLVIPVGNRFSQELKCLRKKGGQIVETKSCGCVFVPLLGEQGWSVDNE
ncbi:MAG: protein-L-isoaspartate(D-aspartate) O-methyltransferase [Candidatus Omnitrophica bacterium]|nr:protein-L-isoaspartate(D-aspartate) O-methyltransferase [Candidatus Omnitrophota bacterium]